MKFRILTVFSVSLTLLIAAGFSYAKGEPPQTTIEGLERVRQLTFDYEDIPSQNGFYCLVEDSFSQSCVPQHP